jgi:NADPH-dependent 2,4-dienoyl-CoA reductase/sulfur reductase-like enzyme
MGSKQPDTVEETKSGGKQAYGTHNYPDHLTHIDKLTWDVVVVGAGPAGLMLTVSFLFYDLVLLGMQGRLS